jgi:hypothetical protein
MVDSDIKIKLFASKARPKNNRSNKSQANRLKTAMTNDKNGRSSDAQLWRKYNSQTVPMLVPSLQPSNNDIIQSLQEIIQSLHKTPTQLSSKTIENLDKKLDVTNDDMKSEIVDALEPEKNGMDFLDAVKKNSQRQKAAKTLQAYARAKIEANDIQPAIMSDRLLSQSIKEDNAATTLQKVLKGRKVRKDYDEFKDVLKELHPPEIKDSVYLRSTGNFVQPIKSCIRTPNDKKELVSLIKSKQKEAGAEAKKEKEELVSLIRTKQKEAEIAKAGRPKLSRAERVGNALMREQMAASNEVPKPPSSPSLVQRLRSVGVKTGEYINGILVSKPPQQQDSTQQAAKSSKTGKNKNKK